MNKFILVLMFSIVMLILCAANTKSDKKTKVADTASVDIKNNSYSNIDKYVMETLNAYRIHATNIIDISGNKYYVSSVDILNTNDEIFDEKKDKENYIYISIWKLNNNKADFVSGFYPYTISADWIGDIVSEVSNNMLEFVLDRYSKKYSCLNFYKFNIVKKNNTVNFYLTNFSERTFKMDPNTGKLSAPEYFFDHDNVMMNDIDKYYEYYNFN